MHAEESHLAAKVCQIRHRLRRKARIYATLQAPTARRRAELASPNFATSGHPAQSASDAAYCAKLAAQRGDAERAVDLLLEASIDLERASRNYHIPTRLVDRAHRACSKALKATEEACHASL